MDLVIVYSRTTDPNDLGTSIVRPAPGAREGDETDQQFAERLLATVVPEAERAAAVICSQSAIPADRYFRNAWVSDPAGVAVDLDKAKAIHLDRMRAVRRPLLAALDVESTRAIEEKDDAKLAQIVAQKNALRDVTLVDLSKADTPEALKDIWPAELGDTKPKAALDAVDAKLKKP